MLCWNLANGPKHRGSYLKNMVCTKVNQLLGNNFHTIMGKIEADIFQIIKKETENRSTNIEDTSAE